MANRSRGRTFSRVPESIKRKKQWGSITGYAQDIFGFLLEIPALVGAGDSLALGVLDVENSPTTVEGTVLRIRGSVTVSKSVLNDDASNSSVAVAFGIGFVTDEAAAAGAVPNPATASGAAWDGWMFIRSSTQSPVDVEGTVMDVKAMRKWGGGMSMVFVAGQASDNASGSLGNSVSAQLRVLFLLP